MSRLWAGLVLGRYYIYDGRTIRKNRYWVRNKLVSHHAGTIVDLVELDYKKDFEAL